MTAAETAALQSTFPSDFRVLVARLLCAPYRWNHVSYHQASHLRPAIFFDDLNANREAFLRDCGVLAEFRA